MIPTRAIAVSLLASIPAVAMAASAMPHLFDAPAASRGAVFDSYRYRAEVKVDANTLFAMKAGSRLSLSVPGLQTYTVVFDRIVVRDGGMREWHGHITGEKDLAVVLTEFAGAVTGVVSTPAKTYKLVHERGANWLVWEYGVTTLAAGVQLGPAPSGETAHTTSPLMTVSDQPLPADAALAINLPMNGTYRAALDMAALSSLPENSETTIVLPNAGRFRILYEGTETSDTGAATWVGYLSEHGNDYRMMVTYTPDGMEGRVQTPAGEYLIHGIGENQYVVDMRRAGMVPAPFPEGDAVKRPTSAHDAVTGVQSATDAVTTTATTGTASTVDLLVLYTPGFVNALGSEYRARTRIDQLVALSNQAYKDSGVAMKLRVVTRQKVDYSDNDYNGDALNMLGYGKGAFSTVFALRDKVGADMVTLLRPFKYDAQKSCGNGYLGGRNGKPMSGYSDYAFSVVSDGWDRASGYYCTDYGLAHELGHNMGNMHDRATERAAGTIGTGAFPYSYGYGIEGRFGTIMSYQSPRIGKFSNPNIYTCDGSLRCGVSEKDATHSANDALSLNNVRTAVAAFRPTRVAQSYGISGTVTYNGKGLKDVVISGNGATCTKTGYTGAYSCTAPGGWSNTLKATRSGYTFKPEKITITNLRSGQSGKNFTAVKN